MKRVLGIVVAALLLATTALAQSDSPDLKIKKEKLVGITILLNAPLDATIIDALAPYGDVVNSLDEIDGVIIDGFASDLPAIQALPFVLEAGLDSERQGGPFASTGISDALDAGLGTWDLDAINVTNWGFGNRAVDYDGTGVYVAVIDTGLIHTWRSYFPEERIATEYGIAFEGGGGDHGYVTDVPNMWERDVNSHGTHVTSTILGYMLGATPIAGVAPNATVIPVKVLNQNGSGWSSMVAMGIIYVANLKAGPLADHPVVINMSLGGGGPDPIEQAAVDYAIGKGVIIVAAAGNEGARGMGYPGAFPQVISAAASGWYGQWTRSDWWYIYDLVDPINPNHFYIADFSSRSICNRRTGVCQDLDVAAPGYWVVGPYQVNQGQLSYYYLSGTSMASPHVAGVVALMAQKNPSLTAAAAEIIIEASAVPMTHTSKTVYLSNGTTKTFTWDSHATGAGLLDAQAALALVP